jgi:hypothetical protein
MMSRAGENVEHLRDIIFRAITRGLKSCKDAEILATGSVFRMILRLVPSVVAFFLLAAHFLRGGSFGLALVCLLLPLLLLVIRRWSLIVMQALAYVGATVWLYTLVDLVQARIILHRPWGIAAIILGAVTFFTIFAGWLLNSPVAQERYSVK